VALRGYDVKASSINPTTCVGCLFVELPSLTSSVINVLSKMQQSRHHDIEVKKKNRHHDIFSRLKHIFPKK